MRIFGFSLVTVFFFFMFFFMGTKFPGALKSVPVIGTL